MKLASRRVLDRVLVASLAAGLVTACGSDPGTHGDDGPDDTWNPTPAEIDQAIATWQAQAIKTCSLDAVFPKVKLEHHEAPREGWDQAVIVKHADPNLVWTTADAKPVSVLFSTFPRRDSSAGQTIVYNQEIKHTATGTTPLVAKLTYENGHCTIAVNDKAIFDDDLHTVRIAGIVPNDAPAKPVRIALVAPDKVPRWLAPIAPGARLVDFSGIADAVSQSLFPDALLDHDAMSAALAPLFQLTPARAADLFGEGSAPLWRDVLVPQAIALPTIGVTRDVNPVPVTYRSSLILGDAEIATLRGAADLRLVWSYANSNNLSVHASKTSKIEITLHRTADLEYQLTSIRYLGTEDKSDALAAACAADHMNRVWQYAGAVPGGNYQDDVEPCKNLTNDLPAAIAGDKVAAATAMKLLGDALRSKSTDVEPTLKAPSDGGPGYGLALWDELYDDLLVDLEAGPNKAALTAAASRITSGYLASLAAIDAHPLAAGARAELSNALASRAIEAARFRFNLDEDYRPLTAIEGGLIDDAVRTDELGGLLGHDVAYVVRLRSLAEIHANAGLTCLAKPTLDAQRPALASLARRAGTDGQPHETWILNVMSALAGWSYTTLDTGNIVGTYCNPDFVTWATQQLDAKTPPCVYGGVTFDRNDYCAK